MDHKSHKISVIVNVEHLKLAKNFHRYQIKISLSFVYFPQSYNAEYSLDINMYIWKQLGRITILHNSSVGQEIIK